MCRAKPGSRRCPCDTSAARNHRRIAARLTREGRLALVPGGGPGGGGNPSEQEETTSVTPEEQPEQEQVSPQPTSEAEQTPEPDPEAETPGREPEEDSGPGVVEERESKPEETQSEPTAEPVDPETSMPQEVAEAEVASPVEADAPDPATPLAAEAAEVRALLADPSIPISERVQRVSALGALLAAEATAKAGARPVISQEELTALGSRHQRLIHEINDLVRQMNQMKYGSPEWEELRSQKTALQAERNETHEQTQAVRARNQVFEARYLGDMAGAYKEVLGQVRELGGTCTNLSTEGVDKGSLKILNEGLDVYPSDWIERSNKHLIPMRVAKTVGRAHYVNYQESKRKKKVNVGGLCIFRNSDGPDPKDSHPSRDHIRWEDLDPAIKEDEFAGHRESSYPGEQVWVRREYEVFDTWSHRSRDGKPVGAGWKQELVYWPRNSEADEDGKVLVWRREKSRMKTVSSYASAVLTVDRDTSLVGPAGQATARHEFGHRVEDAHRDIGLLEAEYVRQRTTDENGVRERVQSYHGKSTERVRPDGFADQYMGKEYRMTDGTISTAFHEILSTGVEGLFNGQFGGFLGMGTYKEDHGTRDFVLGLLASA